VTNNNFRRLLQLCEGFLFQDLVGPLSQFRESGAFQEDVIVLSALNKTFIGNGQKKEHHKREIASLRREVSRVQESFEVESIGRRSAKESRIDGG
jgi:hypothetical protein